MRGNCGGPRNGLGLMCRRERGNGSMLRLAFTDRLREAMKARDRRTISTVRLIIAGLKDRDIAARGQGNAEGSLRSRDP